MKQVQWLAAGFLALIVAGCGGGGTPAVVGGGGLAIVTTPRIEAVVTNLGNVVNGPDGKPIVHDSRNFQANMEFRLQLVGYAADGTRVVLPVSFWSSSDSSATFGLLAQNSGSFSTGTAINNTAEFFTTNYNGVIYSAPFFVKPRQILLQGFVKDGGRATPVNNVTVRFYDTFGALVAVTTSGFNGFYRASVPSNVSRFQVDSETLPAPFWFNYSYVGSVFQAGTADCKPQVSPGNATTGFELGIRDMFDDIVLNPRTAADLTLSPCM